MEEMMHILITGAGEVGFLIASNFMQIMM